MELINALVLEQLYLLYRNAGRNESASLGVVFQSVEAMLQPFGHGGPTLLGESRQLRKPCDRQYAGNDGGIDASGRAQVPEAQVCLDIKRTA